MNVRDALFSTVVIASIATQSLGENPRPIPVSPIHPSTEDIRGDRVFEEPLVPVGGQPSEVENAALAQSILEYSKRVHPDDFSSLTRYLEQFPNSPWKAALLTNLGLEYYKGAYYSLALEAYRESWELGQKANHLEGKLLADRALCELAGLYSRLGRMNELESLLKSVEQRDFIGGATERISLARESLWMMKYQPEISFRCGPLALQRILLSDQSLAISAATNAMMEIHNSASTRQGFSLAQLAELSKKVGLNYQVVFRSAASGARPSPGAAAPHTRADSNQRPRGELFAVAAPEDGPTPAGHFIVPSVVHWKSGHYAALVRQVGDRYQLEDPTFGSTVWATRQALETETSGYCLIPPGNVPRGWRRVDAGESGTVWGKGVTSGIDPDNYTPDDQQAGECGMDDTGMAVSRVHLGLANLQIRDTPVGYTPPVGPPVRFTVRYNHRDYIQRPSAASKILGPKWTHDWNAVIGDNPLNPMADVKYFVGGGGARTFTDFNTNTQTFAPQQFDQTRLKRANPDRYEMTLPDGSKRIFGLRASTSTVLLTQITDPAGNAVTLTHDEDLRLIALTDAIGQVTTLSYDHPTNDAIITKVTDPFGRFATFDYTTVTFKITNCCPTNVIEVELPMLAKITDVLGLESRFLIVNDGYIPQMITPYGTTTFFAGQSGPNQTTRLMRFVESLYPDGSRDRVEFNQNTNSIAFSDSPERVPQGMNVFNQWLFGRNTFYWSRNACATGYGDYSKAKIYHWLHAPNIATTAGILESVKEPLESRVWYSYAGQNVPFHTVGNTDQPSRVGRVLDDGTTQLYSYSYSDFGHVTHSIDPIGRQFSFVYAANGIDLLEVRQVRGLNDELLFRASHNTQHRPVTVTDAAGQTRVMTYNARGQLQTETNAKNETTTYTYDNDGYLIAVDGPLPGTDDSTSVTHDAFGRVRTMTDVSGYTLIFDYDAMDRLVRVTHPDFTFTQYAYDRLDLVSIRHRDGQHTLLEYDNVGQPRKQTDSSGRVTRFSWCGCGSVRSLIDPMGRTTEWETDIQGRLTRKQYSDGSRVSYVYENTTSRLRQVIDEKEQVTQYAYNRDDTLKSIGYGNSAIPTPGVSFAYDTNYEHVVSMTDGTGTTRYSYHPISTTPMLGAGRLASIDGPLTHDTITCRYDELGRRVSTAISGVAWAMTYDAAGRIAGESNALGAFAYAYDGASRRLVARFLPNNQMEERQYGGNLLDQTLQRITHRIDATRISEFLYEQNIAAGRIRSWSQQSGAQLPFVHTFGYDSADQLLSVTVTNAGTLVNALAYSYDAAGNRLSEQASGLNHTATYNALNQISTSTAPAASRINEWDAENRLIAVTEGTRRTEFTYDGHGRRVSIRQLLDGSEVTHRRFVWCGAELCEERDATGAVVKRFFPQGVTIEIGPVRGAFFYTRDHLGSIRELTDASGTVRARYAYDPYGRRTKLAGDVEADFAFAGMFWSPEANLSLTLYRAYDPELGRWLSRDPLENAELHEGPNLYAYVANDPVNAIDPLGLACAGTPCLCAREPGLCAVIAAAGAGGATAARALHRAGPVVQAVGQRMAQCGRDLWGRVQAIAERMPDALREARAFIRNPDFTTTDRFQAIGNIAYPVSPQLVYEVQLAFDEVVVALATKYGITLEQARAWLIFLTGGDPTKWGL